jgi:hypothetical protein
VRLADSPCALRGVAITLLRCQECQCVTEDARDWIALLVDDEEESEASVVAYCPVCPARELFRPRKRRLIP